MKFKLLEGVKKSISRFSQMLKITIAIMLVVVTLGLAYLVTPFFGNKVLIVRSGSMAPTLPVGSLVVTHSKNNMVSPLPAVPLYSPGDIISFKDTHNPKTVTSHRIVTYKIDQGFVTYQTKGDANNNADQNLVAEKNVLGNVRLTIPFLGILFAFTKTKVGFMLLVLIPSLVVVLWESLNIIKELRKKKLLRYTYLKNYTEKVSMTAMVPLLAVGLVFTQTHAYFSNAGTSTNNVFAAAQSFPTPTLLQNIANHVVISEVQITAGSLTLNDHDFIELYNPTNSTINLGPTRLVKRSTGSSTDTDIVVFSNTATIAPHSYLLWANSANGYATSIGADFSSTDILSTNDSVALRNDPDNTGLIIDALSWDSSVNSLKEGTEFSPDPTANQSLERKAYSTSTDSTMNGGVDSTKGNSYDTDNNSTDFVLRTTSQPQNSTSPTETP